MKTLFDKFTMIDLTHSLASNIPTWDGSIGFRLQTEGENDQIIMNTSTGTHMDAPSLFFEKGTTIDSLALQELLVSACVLDVSKKVSASYVISIEDILEYETQYGPISENSLVIGYTGWSRYWSNPVAYRNADEKGIAHFPTFSIQSIEFLLTRKIAGIAIDTLALESLSSTFPGHKLLLKAGKYIIENIANVFLLPPKEAYVIALPMKIQKGFEAPARVIGLVPAWTSTTIVSDYFEPTRSPTPRIYH